MQLQQPDLDIVRTACLYQALGCKQTDQVSWVFTYSFHSGCEYLNLIAIPEQTKAQVVSLIKQSFQPLKPGMALHFDDVFYDNRQAS